MHARQAVQHLTLGACPTTQIPTARKRTFATSASNTAGSSNSLRCPSIQVYIHSGSFAKHASTFFRISHGRWSRILSVGRCDNSMP